MAESIAKLSSRAQENEAVLARRRPQEQTTPATDIKSNPFFVAAFNPATTPEEKQKELASLLSSEGTKEQLKERVNAYDSFKAWAQEQRQNMASALLQATDTETFAELQATYDTINNDLIEFDNAMKPQLEIIDAVYKIRTASPTGTTDAYRAIKDAASKDAERQKRLNDVTIRFDAAQSAVTALTQQIEVEKTKKGMFGFGGITKEAQANIAAWNVTLNGLMAELEKIGEEKLAVENEAKDALGAGTNIDPQALATLRDMLNIKSEEHIRRQKDLVEKAKTFIANTKTRVNSITNHLNGQDARLDKIYDANSQMTMLYALLSGSSEDAKTQALARREKLMVKPEGETKLAQMQREDQLQVLNEFIERLETTTVDTDLTFADLTTGSIRIDSMRRANRNQINKAQTMQTRGIAGVADRLVTTVQAVSTAAITEAQAAAIATNRAMIDSTNEIAQKEVIKNATGMDDMNEDLRRAFDDLAAYKDVADTAGEISRAAMSEMRENLEAARSAAIEVQDSAKAQISAVADTLSTTKAGSGVITSKKGTATVDDVFGLKSA